MAEYVIHVGKLPLHFDRREVKASEILSPTRLKLHRVPEGNLKRISWAISLWTSRNTSTSE